MRRSVARACQLVLTTGLAGWLIGCGGGAAVKTPVPPKAARPTPPPPARGTIAGRVVSVASKEPLSRARVWLSADCDKPAPANGPPCEKVLPQNRVTWTDADGRFRLSGLPVAANFVLRAGRTGYAPRAYGELPPAQLPSMIALKLDETRDNLTIELVPEVVLTGSVQDSDGTPFEGALVEALRAVYSEGHRDLVTVSQAQTDDRGQFRLSQLPPGQYYISAFDPAFADVGDAAGPLFYSPTFYPSASSPEQASRVTLEPGVTLDPLAVKLQIVRPSRVSGTLRPGTDMQMTGGSIELGPTRMDKYASLSDLRVSIRPDGSYQFANVPPGEYIIRARGETVSAPAAVFGTFALSISGQDRSGIDISMSPGAILQGFVEWQGAARPPADVTTVIVRAPMTDGSLFGDVPTGNLNPDRTFKIRGVQQGAHYIRVEGLENTPWSLKRVELNGADVTDVPVQFRYQQTETGLRIILTDVSSDFGGKVNVTGRDVLHGYSVIAFSTNATAWHPHSRHVAIAHPDDTGQYRIHGLPPAEYFLAVTRDLDEGDLADAKALEALSRASGVQRVPLREGEKKPVNLTPVRRPAAPVR